MRAQVDFVEIRTHTCSVSSLKPCPVCTFLSVTVIVHAPAVSLLTYYNLFSSVWLVFSSPVEKCMSAMQMGTQMVKLRGSSKGLVRFFYLDEHKSCIRWRPSRKNEKAKSECLLPFFPAVTREQHFTSIVQCIHGSNFWKGICAVLYVT